MPPIFETTAKRMAPWKKLCLDLYGDVDGLSAGLASNDVRAIGLSLPSPAPVYIKSSSASDNSETVIVIGKDEDGVAATQTYTDKNIYTGYSTTHRWSYITSIELESAVAGTVTAGWQAITDVKIPEGQFRLQAQLVAANDLLCSWDGAPTSVLNSWFVMLKGMILTEVGWKSGKRLYVGLASGDTAEAGDVLILAMDR